MRFDKQKEQKQRFPSGIDQNQPQSGEQLVLPARQTRGRNGRLLNPEPDQVGHGSGREPAGQS